MNQRFWGLSPRNLEQAMAMRLLDSEDVDRRFCRSNRLG